MMIIPSCNNDNNSANKTDAMLQPEEEKLLRSKLAKVQRLMEEHKVHNKKYRQYQKKLDEYKIKLTNHENAMFVIQLKAEKIANKKKREEKEKERIEQEKLQRQKEEEEAKRREQEERERIPTMKEVITASMGNMLDQPPQQEETEAVPQEEEEEEEVEEEAPTSTTTTPLVNLQAMLPIKQNSNRNLLFSEQHNSNDGDSSSSKDPNILDIEEEKLLRAKLNKVEKMIHEYVLVNGYPLNKKYQKYEQKRDQYKMKLTKHENALYVVKMNEQKKKKKKVNKKQQDLMTTATKDKKEVYTDADANVKKSKVNNKKKPSSFRGPSIRNPALMKALSEVEEELDLCCCKGGGGGTNDASTATAITLEDDTTNCSTSIEEEKEGDDGINLSPSPVFKTIEFNSSISLLSIDLRPLVG